MFSLFLFVLNLVVSTSATNQGPEAQCFDSVIWRPRP